MQGIMKLNQKWWFGAVIGAVIMAALVSVVLTTGVSFEAAGVEVVLEPHATNGLELRFVSAK